MAGFRATQIRIPASEVEFEKNCVILFSELLSDPNVKRRGTRGQRQHGVDLDGHRDRDPNQIVGIQCKLKTHPRKLKEKEVRQEVRRALGYTPHLTEYFIVTTSKDDVKLTQLAQELMREQEAAGRRLQIEVWGWDTLQEKIDKFERAKQAFDPGFSPSVAAQDRKLDALLVGQQQAATQDQIAALVDLVGKERADTVSQLPPDFADRELAIALSRTLRRRGFAGTDTASELSALAERVIDGDLSRAKNSLRSEACDRAARANATADTLTSAQRFRANAASIDPSRDLFIVDALLKEAEGDPDGTLRLLKTHRDEEARSALFMSLARQRDGEAALAWVRAEELAPSGLNAAGAMNLVLHQIEQGAFDEALADIRVTPEGYFDQCPALRLVRVQLTLASLLPSDRKAILFQGLPLDPSILKLAAGPTSAAAIKAAGEDLRALLRVLAELELGHLETFLSEFDLWLRLEDPSAQSGARTQLASEIADPAKTLQRVRLALAYNVPFNQEALQRHLAKRKEIGGWTSDERLAAFLIAYHSDDPAKISEFFDSHHDDLFAQTDLVHSALAGIEIEVLARTGRFDEARRHIALHRGEDLTPEQAADLENLIAHIEKGDEIESLRQRYAQSQSLTDLRLLVGGLRAKRDTRHLAVYAPALARATRTLEDFDVAIKSLFRANRLSEVLALAEDLPDLCALDDEYAAIKGWSLYGLGRVMEAREIVRELIQKRDVGIDRELAINTAVESGDWGHLQAILAREAARADTLPTKDLNRLARLALEASSPYVDHFRDAALRKAPDDPSVNLAAYMLAIERGEEYRGSQAQEWFRKAIEQSGPEGPVQSISLRELVDRAPGWNEHTDNVDQLLRRAEVPLFVAARGVRRQLIDLTLGQALRNADRDDRRLRYPVFAISGARPILDISSAKCAAFDITALITFDYLGLLEMALGHFERIVIAPKTLGFLFTERQFLKIHQPSEVAKAARIQALIAAGRLKILPSASTTLPSMAKEIGRDLATLLAEAHRAGGLVVRTAPVARLGSILEESADMSAYAPVLTDTLSVLSFLANRGKVDAATRKSAEAYLGQVDKGWAASHAIDGATTLYLDDLAVTYLDHAGLLDGLTQCASSVFVYEDVEKQTRQLLRHAKNADDILGAIERIRVELSTVADAGRIHFSGRQRQDGAPEEEQDGLFDGSPTLDLLSDLSGIDIVIADDRYLNKLPNWTDSSEQTAISGAVIDVLVALRGAGQLDDETYWNARHQLRTAGYYAVPLEVAELVHHLANAPVAEAKVCETPELQAVRESIALPLVNNCFIPTETNWLNGVRFAVFGAIRETWLETPDLDRAAARADWLLTVLPNPLEWCLTPDNEPAWAAARHQAATQVALLMVLAGASGERRKRYFAWLNDRLLLPLRRDHQEIWDSALDFLKSYIPHLTEIDDDQQES